MTSEEIVERSSASGLRGRGGAGFPTGRKASFLAAGEERYLVVNADESEPGSCKDRELMLRNPHALIEGILIMSFATRARHAFIYIRGEYLTEAEILRGGDRAGARARARGRRCSAQRLRGRHRRAPRRGRLHLRRGDGPSQLAQRLARAAHRQAAVPGRLGRVRAAHAAQQRRDARDDPSILRMGAAEYATIGTEQSTGTRVLSLSGHVQRPGNYELPLDATLRDLIEGKGGGVPEGRTLKAIVPGGSSAPVLGADGLDVGIAIEALAAAGTMAGSGGVIVIDDRTCMVQLALRTAEFYMHESCGKCTPCREGTRWTVDTLRRIEHGVAEPSEIELLLEICDNIEGKCLCPLGDACAMPVRSIVKRFREEFDAHLSAGTCPLHDTSSMSSLYPLPRTLLPLVAAS